MALLRSIFSSTTLYTIIVLLPVWGFADGIRHHDATRFFVDLVVAGVMVLIRIVYLLERINKNTRGRGPR